MHTLYFVTPSSGVPRLETLIFWIDSRCINQHKDIILKWHQLNFLHSLPSLSEMRGNYSVRSRSLGGFLGSSWLYILQLLLYLTPSGLPTDVQSKKSHLTWSLCTVSPASFTAVLGFVSFSNILLTMTLSSLSRENKMNFFWFSIRLFLSLFQSTLLPTYPRSKPQSHMSTLLSVDLQIPIDVGELRLQTFPENTKLYVISLLTAVKSLLFDMQHMHLLFILQV